MKKRWNKCDKVWNSAISLYKRRFVNRRRRFCLSSLIPRGKRGKGERPPTQLMVLGDHSHIAYYVVRASSTSDLSQLFFPFQSLLLVHDCDKENRQWADNQRGRQYMSVCETGQKSSVVCINPVFINRVNFRENISRGFRGDKRNYPFLETFLTTLFMLLKLVKRETKESFAMRTKRASGQHINIKRWRQLEYR